jgi:uncharacterized membrane protein YgcG
VTPPVLSLSPFPVCLLYNLPLPHMSVSLIPPALRRPMCVVAPVFDRPVCLRVGCVCVGYIAECRVPSSVSAAVAVVVGMRARFSRRFRVNTPIDRFFSSDPPTRILVHSPNTHPSPSDLSIASSQKQSGSMYGGGGGGAGVPIAGGGGLNDGGGGGGDGGGGGYRFNDDHLPCYQRYGADSHAIAASRPVIPCP